MSRFGSPLLPFLLIPALAAAGASAPGAAQDEEFDTGPPQGWPQTIVVPELPPAPQGTGALPEPSLTEPFAIGEALYDASRGEEAIVSLLALMGVPIVGDDGRPLRAGLQSGAPPFHLTESEVRAFAARAAASARVAAQSGEGSLTFADLHRAVAPALPGWSAERLAAAYSTAYERRPGDLAPGVLLGQPIEADTPLLFPQLWLLLADGFAPPAGTPRAGRPALARFTPPGGAAWGTAAAALPPSPPQYNYFETLGLRIALWIMVHGPRITPAAASPHEGHGGPGTTVTFVASLDPNPGPVTSSDGRAIYAPRQPPLLAGLKLWWSSPAEDRLLDHGSFSEPLARGAVTDGTGSVRLDYQPKAETARGQGRMMRDTATLEARVDAGDLAQAYFDIPGLADFLFEEYAQPPSWGAAQVTLGWHELETIEISIQNVYGVRLPLGDLGTAMRRGRDTVRGTLAKAPDGTWHGMVSGVVDGTNQELQAFGQGCGVTRILARQDLHIVGTPINAFGPTHPSGSYQWTLNQPGSEKLSLEFFPATEPEFRGGRSPCWPAIPSRRAVFPFIPFNDAQWTTEYTGYGIALPDEGKLSYVERGTNTPAFGVSTWYITIDREKAVP